MNRSTLNSLIRYSRRMLSSVTVPGLLFISLNTLVTAPADAAIYKCISGSGAVTYSGRKCPEQDTTVRIIADSGVGSTQRRQAQAVAEPTPSPHEQQKKQREAELEP